MIEQLKVRKKGRSLENAIKCCSDLFKLTGSNDQITLGKQQGRRAALNTNNWKYNTCKY